VTKKISPITVAGIVFTILFFLLNLKSPRAMDETIESLIVDYRFLLRNILNPPPVSKNILIVVIDDKSLEKYGRWPWPRSVQAKLIDKIISGSPSVVAVDIFYSEHETEERDSALGTALNQGDEKIVIAVGFDMDNSGVKEVPDYLLDSAILKVKDNSRLKGKILEVYKFKSTISEIYSNAVLGHVISPPDMDGKLRWEHLYIQYQDDYYPSLSLMTAAVAMKKDINDITIYGARGVELGEIFIPTDMMGRMRINYIGSANTFRYLSAADVLNDKIHSSVFDDKIVFLGTSAISTYDFMVTPFSARIPAVEKNATVVDNILNRQFIKSVPVSMVSTLIIVSGLFLSFMLPAVRAVFGIGFSILMILLFVLFNQYLFTYQSTYLNFIYPFSNLFIISGIFAAYKYFVEEKKAKQLRKMFSSYVSPKIVTELINNPDMVGLGGYRREITVLFADIAGFTSFSETREPEEVVSMLNEYFKEMTDVIFKWDGTLDKFVGDEIMAFWGAPLEQPDHAELAVKCALEMSERLNSLQKKWKSEGKYILDCGIGINTGIVLIGNIGSADKKMDYTAIGDHVNLGARVESMTRKYDTRILITQYTYEKIAELIDKNRIGHIDMLVCAVDTVKVKGREVPIKMFSVVSKPHSD